MLMLQEADAVLADAEAALAPALPASADEPAPAEAAPAPAVEEVPAEVTPAPAIGQAAAEGQAPAEEVVQATIEGVTPPLFLEMELTPAQAEFCSEASPKQV